jgi:hypothetical protein
MINAKIRMIDDERKSDGLRIEKKSAMRFNGINKLNNKNVINRH